MKKLILLVIIALVGCTTPKATRPVTPGEMGATVRGHGNEIEKSTP